MGVQGPLASDPIAPGWDLTYRAAIGVPARLQRSELCVLFWHSGIGSSMKAGQILRVALAALLASGIAGALPKPAMAVSTISDLGVEDTTGWSVAYESAAGDGALAEHSTTDWTIVDAATALTIDGAEGGPTYQHIGPDSGDFYYLIPASRAPSARVLYRSITLPSGMRSTLSYSYFVRSWYPFIDGGTMSLRGFSNNQQFRVDLVTPALATAGTWFQDPTIGLLTNLSLATAPTPLTESWKSVTVDLTPWAGQTVVLAFRQVDNGNPFSAGVDTVSIRSDVLPLLDVPTLVTKPALSGYAAVGAVLTGTAGSWSNIYSLIRPQWYRCTKAGAAVAAYTPDTAPAGCSVISGATDLAYTAVAADKGKYLRMRSGGSGSGGQLFSFSKATAKIGTAPVSKISAPPTVGGVVKVGRTLAAAKGTWTGTPTPTYAYQWYRCTATGVAAATVPDTCTIIAGATKSTYKLLAADKTSGYIRVKVTATSTAGVAERVSAAKKIQ